MNRSSFIMALLVASGVWLATPCQAQEAVRLTLAEVIQLAAERPANSELEANARAVASAARAEWFRATLPTIALRGSWSRLDSDLYVRTQFGDLPLGEPDWPEIGVEVTQPIFDPARLFYSAPAASNDAEASRYLAHRRREELQAEAAEAFVEVLVVDAQIDATEGFLAYLQRQLEEIESLRAVGRILEADALQMEVALDETRHELYALRNLRQVAVYNLGRTIGMDGPVEPVVEDFLIPNDPPEMDSAIDTALAQRDDLMTLGLQLRAVERRHHGVWGELIPRVEILGRWVWSQRDVLVPNEWLEGTIQLIWVPLAALTRVARASALEAESVRLQANIGEVRTGIALQVRQALAEYDTALNAIPVRQRAVEQAAESLRIVEALQREDRATPAQLIEAQASVRESQTRHELAKLDALLAWIHVQLAMGLEIGQGLDAEP